MILSRIRILPQERFDLEDLNALMAAARTDSKYNVKKLLSNLNYVVNGFSVTGIGLKSATVNMTDGTLIVPQNTNDFSWFTTSPTDPNVVIPDADLIDGTRNYVEIELINQNNTPVTRAFWDPEANGGQGLEFNQIVDTITDLAVRFVVLTGGFSGSPDRLPLCMIDTDSTGTIKAILDERRLFHRLGTPSDPAAQYNMGVKEEPGYALTLNGATGVFQVGETINIGTEIATVLSGGTSGIVVQLPSSKNFYPGDTVTGLTSGATGTLSTAYESFTGVDKTTKNLKEDLDAIKTEILLLKNPDGFWWSQTESIVDLRSSIDAIADLLDDPSYDEDIEVTVTIPQGSQINLPPNTRKANNQQFYTVGYGALEVFLNGQRLSQNVAGGWKEIGVSGAASMKIEIDQELVAEDILAVRLGLGGAGNVDNGGGGGGGGGGSGSLDFNNLPESTTADNLDFIVIRDVSLNQYRKQKRSTFLAGLGSTIQVNTYATNHTADANNDKLILMDTTLANRTLTLPDPTTCNGVVFQVKNIGTNIYSMIINGAGFMIDGEANLTTNVSFESFTLVADAANGCWWII